MFGISIPSPQPGTASHVCSSCGRVQMAGEREVHEDWCPKLPAAPASSVMCGPRWSRQVAERAMRPSMLEILFPAPPNPQREQDEADMAEIERINLHRHCTDYRLEAKAREDELRRREALDTFADRAGVEGLEVTELDPGAVGR